VIRGGLAAALLLASAVPGVAQTGLLLAPKKAEAEGTTLRLRTDPAGLSALDLGRFSFTTPGDAAARGPRGATIDRSFRFTPSGKSDARAFSVGVAARTASTGLEAASPGVRSVVAAAGNRPAGYEVDMALGWKGFSLSGGVASQETGRGLSAANQVDVGLSYGGRRWRTGVTAAAERGSLVLPGAPAKDADRYALGASGAVALSPALSLSGGVLYRTKPLNPGLLQADRQEEAVYIGGALAF
jgi:hypothetical protein